MGKRDGDTRAGHYKIVIRQSRALELVMQLGQCSRSGQNDISEANVMKRVRRWPSYILLVKAKLP